jgi:hypothetical protein
VKFAMLNLQRLGLIEFVVPINVLLNCGQKEKAKPIFEIDINQTPGYLSNMEKIMYSV